MTGPIAAAMTTVAVIIAATADNFADAVCGDVHRRPAVGATFPVTRQIVLPTSSATRSAPARSTATPTGRPRASPLSIKPVSTSSGMPLGAPVLERHEDHFVAARPRAVP